MIDGVFLNGKEGRVGFQNQISSFISTMPLARKLNQLENQLIEFFYLPEIEDDTIWENDRNEFLKSMGEGLYEHGKFTRMDSSNIVIYSCCCCSGNDLQMANEDRVEENT